MSEQIMKELNQALFSLYFKNIQYLKKSHPKVFKKVMSLSKLIETKNYKEKYALDYKEEGYFDVLNLQTNKFLYGLNSYIEADFRKNNLDYSQSSSINLLRIDPRYNNFALMDTLEEIRPLVHYMNKNIDFSKITFSKIYKMIYLGTGLGFHISEIHKKIDSYITLIIEDNLEIFRLSLFTNDYTIFDKDNRVLFLSIQEDDIEKRSMLNEFEVSSSWFNYNIKHHIFTKEEKSNLDKIIEYFSIQYASAFSYKEVLKVISRTAIFIEKKYPFLKLDLMEKSKPLKNKEVLVISAGPSIDECIQWIKINQEKFIIICVDIIIKKLERHNIKPDMVVSVDPKKIIGSFFDTKDKIFLKNSAIIFASQQHKDVIEKVKDLNFYFIQPFPVSKELDFHFSTPNVGAYSLVLALLLGSNKIYLAGSDGAFDQKTGSRYSKDDTKIQIDALEDLQKFKENGIVSDGDVIEVKGNLRNKVKTNRELLRFKEPYEEFLQQFKDSSNEGEEPKIYNISNGIYMEGFIPKDFNKIDLTRFKQKEFSYKIIDRLSTPLKPLEFNDDIKKLEDIIKRVKKFEKVKIKTKDEFIIKKIDLMVLILKKKKDMSNVIFSDLFLRFTNLIDIYINYCLNLEQETLKGQDFLMNLKRYWSFSLISLLKQIKKTILKV